MDLKSILKRYDTKSTNMADLTRITSIETQILKYWPNLKHGTNKTDKQNQNIIIHQC